MKEKKIYWRPEMCVILMAEEDVIRTSSDNDVESGLNPLNIVDEAQTL